MTIPAGQISVAFDVPINDDNVFEESEEFLLTIDQSSSLNDVIIGSQNVTVVNITDNDGKFIAHSLVVSKHKLYTLDWYSQLQSTATKLECKQHVFIKAMYFVVQISGA